MQVTGSKCERVSITLDEQSIEDVVKHNKLPLDTSLKALSVKFRKDIGFDEDCYIKDGYWFETNEVCGGSHGWDETIKHRKATQAEIDFLEKLRELSEILVLVKIS